MKAVRIEPNGDGSYTAWIFSTSHRSTYDECKAWIHAHGERL